MIYEHNINIKQKGCAKFNTYGVQGRIRGGLGVRSAMAFYLYF